VTEVWNQVRDEQASWPAVTDCDRLDSAFAELDRRRIIARQNFWCCDTDALASIWEEAEDWPHDPRGYTFFHEQATDAAVDGFGLTLSYGSTDQTDVTVTAIADEVVEVLRAHGLNATWDGDRRKKIMLSLDWKRRIEPPAASTTC
jgi:Domain of unknown function (DUF6891)